MKVKIFDEAHEADLEEKVNDFLEKLESELIEIKFQVSISISGEVQ